MQNKNTIQFTLKPEHIALAKELNLKVVRDHSYHWLIPTVDAKRPFGNSDMLGDIFNIMGIDPDADGNYAETDRLSAYLLLAELPAAMEVIMNYETFTPGVYQVSADGGAFAAQIAKNYIILSPALNVLKENQELSKYHKYVEGICSSIMEDDPWSTICDMLMGSLVGLSPEDSERKEIEQILNIFEDCQKKTSPTTK